MHFAPPCASFSRARDRAKRTKLRSTDQPGGLTAKAKSCREPNAIARKCFKLANWAARTLKAKVSIENPAGSYLWAFSETFENDVDDVQWEDVELDTCRFGAPYKKSTRLRCWNWKPTKLAKKCTKEGDTYTCGVQVSKGHAVLGFEGLPTSQAAAYVPGLCREWALAMADVTSTDAAAGEPLAQVKLVNEGKVKRHRTRGVDPQDAREVREQEDKDCKAGMRNSPGWRRAGQSFVPPWRRSGVCW